MVKISNLNQTSNFNIDKLRKDVTSGKRLLRITSHAQIEAFKDRLLLKHLLYVFEQGEVIETYPDDNRGLLYAQIKEKEMICSVCSEKTSSNGIATQVFRRNGLTVTVTGIPAVAICPHCGNAVLDWKVAQEVEDLVQPLFEWTKTHSLPKPIISITFPEMHSLAA